VRFVDPTKPDANDKVLDESTEVEEETVPNSNGSNGDLMEILQMEFEKDRDTKESNNDNDGDEKVKSSENVSSVKDSGSPEKLPISDDEEDEDEEEDDKNTSDSKSSSAPGTDDKKKKP
jgi:hypothetical protein